MKKEDLRLNNLAQDENGNLLKVVELNENGVIYSVIDRKKYPLPDGWKAEPIPLTEEWLVKFGFSMYDGIYKLKAGAYFCIQLCGNQLYYSADEYHISGVAIEYVHQLQNLYFALTGEELKQKE